MCIGVMENFFDERGYKITIEHELKVARDKLDKASTHYLVVKSLIDDSKEILSEIIANFEGRPKPRESQYPLG